MYQVPGIARFFGTRRSVLRRAGSASPPAASDGGSRPPAPSTAALGNFHAAELLLRAVKRRRADPVLTAQLRRLHASLTLLQNPNDLLFTETEKMLSEETCT